jgi:hypothetical protein
VLYDVPGHRGVGALPAGSPATADELLAIEAETGVAAGAGDVALVRTGYLAGWPDPDRLAASRGGGPDISAARMLLERGVVATGSDTETYEVPAGAGPRRAREPATAARPSRSRLWSRYTPCSINNSVWTERSGRPRRITRRARGTKSSPQGHPPTPSPTTGR